MIELRWDDTAKDIAVWQVLNNWTLEEFYGSIDSTREMALSRAGDPNSRFDLIVMMPSNFLPASGGLFPAMGRGAKEMAKFNGVIVVVVQHTYQRIVIDFARRGSAIVGAQFFVADSLDDARAKIETDRQRAI